MADEKNRGSESPGQADLIDNGQVVQSFWNIVNNDASSVALIPGYVKKILATGAWAKRIQRGKVLENATFSEFITAKPLNGCGWPLDKVEKLIEDDADAITMWRKAVTEGAGRPSKNGNNITNKERVTGTSRAYTLDRLSREAPGLHGAVCRGEMSANRAAIEAGFRKPPAPFETIRKLLPKLTPEERRQLRDML